MCLFHVSSDKNSYFEAFLVMVGASCQFVVSRLGRNHLSNLTNKDNIFLFLIGCPTCTLYSFQLGHLFRVPSLMVRPKVGLVLS